MSNDNSKELLELSKKTTRIDKLINKNNSGKNAWEAGKLLYEIKENKEYKAKEYKNFGVYTNNDLRISETKAVNYINIYLLYDDENISSLILVTHLTYLAKQDHDIRDAVLEILKDEDQKTIAGFKKLSKKPKASLFGNEEKNIEKEEKMQIRPDYDKDIIIGTTNLLEAAKNSAQEVTPILAKEAFDIVNETNRRDFSATKLPNVIGELLKSSHFPEIENLYKSEPTNEMGLVALFCTMFHLLKGKKISE